MTIVSPAALRDLSGMVREKYPDPRHPFNQLASIFDQCAVEIETRDAKIGGLERALAALGKVTPVAKAVADEREACSRASRARPSGAVTRYVHTRRASSSAATARMSSAVAVRSFENESQTRARSRKGPPMTDSDIRALGEPSK